MVRIGTSGTDLNGSFRGGSCQMLVVRIYILPTSDVCVDSNPTNAAASIGDLNIQGGTFDFGSTSTSISGNITNDGTITGGSGTILWRVQVTKPLVVLVP